MRITGYCATEDGFVAEVTPTISFMGDSIESAYSGTSLRLPQECPVDTPQEGVDFMFLLVFFGYLFIASFWIFVLRVLYGARKQGYIAGEGGDGLTVFFASILWPIAIPMLLAFKTAEFVGEFIRAAIKNNAR